MRNIRVADHRTRVGHQLAPAAPRARSSILKDWLATLPILLLVPALMIPMAVTWATAPKISLLPATADPGQKVKVVGENFGAREAGRLTWDGSATGMPAYQANGRGTFRTILKVPAGAAAGEHRVAAVAAVGTDLTSPERAWVTITVRGAVASPSPSPSPLPSPSPSPLPSPSPSPLPSPSPSPVVSPPSSPSPSPTVRPSPSPSPTASPSASVTPGTPRTLVPSADARVEAANPALNYGATNLRVDGGTDPAVESYLRFDVSGAGAITSAKLRLYATSGTVDGPAAYTATNSWTEAALTWNTRPARASAAAADVSAISATAWVDYDVSAVVRGDGSYTFVLVGTTTDGVDFASRESGSNSPQLLLNGGGSTPSPSPSATPSPTSPAPSPTSSPGSGDLVVAAAGDIACPGVCGQDETANLITDVIKPDAVLGLGDYQYDFGTLSAFNSYYEPYWGRFKSKTYAINGGSHDYYGTGDYLSYFNAGGPVRLQPEGSYSFNLGSWHFVALNSYCFERSSCDEVAVTNWLKADLAANKSYCTIAYFHQPYWTSPSNHNRNMNTRPWIQALYDADAELVLQAHNHTYERFLPMTPSDVVDHTRGLQAFVVGTGGRSHYGFTGTTANSVVRNADTFGVLKLTLRSTGYDWEFVPEPGKTFRDSGTRSCHGPNAPDAGGSASPSPSAAPSPTPSVSMSPSAAPTTSPSASPVAALFACFVSPAGNDANPGTIEQPLRTAQRAAEVAASGTTVYLREGTYAGFDVRRSGLTFTSYPGETAVVSDTSRQNVILVEGVTSATIQSLVVQGGSFQWGAGIRVASSSGVAIERSTLRNNRSFGVKLKASTNVRIADNDITKNETGIEVDGGSDVRIENNRIYQNDRMVVNDSASNNDRGANAIVAYRTSGVTAHRNTIWGNRATSIDYGYDGGGFEVYASSNLTFSENVLWDNQNVLETGTDGTAPCDGLTFTRNVAYGASSVSGQAEGLILRCASNSTFSHNTLDGLDNFTWYVTASASSFGGSIENLKIFNNAAVNGRIYSLDSGLPASVMIDYNLAYNPGGVVAYAPALGNTSSFGSLQSLGFEQHGISADPRFVAPATRDYRLATDSPAIDRGKVGSEPYHGSAPDLGRHETGS